ncbi:MAG: aminotransferase class [Frankiales bacterium]|nr:aminotransferase class [Frankiales bacterium]
MTVHLDAATAAPLRPAAREALLTALDDGWADPDRRYAAGRHAQRLRQAAAETVAAAVGARPDEVVLVAGDVLATTLGVLGLLQARRRAGDGVVHSAVEHSAVLHAAATARAVEVGVDARGRVDAGAFAAAVTAPGVALAALQSANGEVGTRQPVAEAAEACGASGVPLLVDATASLGRAPVPAGWSVLTGAARTFGGPAGVSLLVVRTGTRFAPVLPGQERAPLAPVPLAVATAVALQAAVAESAAEDARLRPLVARLRTEVAARVPGVDVVGDPDDRLPGVLTFSCLYVDGESLTAGLDAQGFAVSSGSACTSSTLQPSHVLAAMGALTSGNVRVSLSRTTTADDVERFLVVLPGVVSRLRREAGVEGLL